MSKPIFLDSGPLGILVNARVPAPAPTTAINFWVEALLAAGHQVIVPAIADFEVRRELVRAGKLQSVALLDGFYTTAPNRYLPLSDAALKRAAALWAQARNAGNLPADPKELNGGVLIAAQVSEYQAAQNIAVADLIVVTVNLSHISLFVPAAPWTGIAP